ncbi:hypothetical protein E2C01_066134 [Portunus trituberculatus]|uniref:Uncharacterized protein n=1 Tax=Portunus trituberculatus TaxID=210409 RepID=A0A5B7HTP4_PORTR|nr:hypothetical protein [Portunus trituberculatus]
MEVYQAAILNYSLSLPPATTTICLCRSLHLSSYLTLHTTTVTTTYSTALHHHRSTSFSTNTTTIF